MHAIAKIRTKCSYKAIKEYTWLWKLYAASSVYAIRNALFVIGLYLLNWLLQDCYYLLSTGLYLLTKHGQAAKYLSLSYKGFLPDSPAMYTNMCEIKILKRVSQKRFYLKLLKEEKEKYLFWIYFLFSLYAHKSIYIIQILYCFLSLLGVSLFDLFFFLNY